VFGSGHEVRKHVMLFKATLLELKEEIKEKNNQIRKNKER